MVGAATAVDDDIMGIVRHRLAGRRRRRPGAAAAAAADDEAAAVAIVIMLLLVPHVHGHLLRRGEAAQDQGEEAASAGHDDSRGAGRGEERGGQRDKIGRARSWQAMLKRTGGQRIRTSDFMLENQGDRLQISPGGRGGGGFRRQWPQVIAEEQQPRDILVYKQGRDTITTGHSWHAITRLPSPCPPPPPPGLGNAGPRHMEFRGTVM